MRVTNNMLISSLKKNISTSLRRMQRSHNEVETGKRFSMPSDDPVGVARSLKLRADLNENKQFKKNAEDALSWLETSETVLMHIKEVLQKVRVMALQGANGILVPEDSHKIAEEAMQLRDHLVSLGNSTYMGKYIFAGNKTNTVPVALRDSDDGLNYNGDDGIIVYQVGVSDVLRANFIAPDIFRPDDDMDLLQDMKHFIDYLSVGDFEGIGGMITKFDAHIDNILTKVAEVGAKSNRMELTVNRLRDEKLNFTTLLSMTEDTDMAEAIIQLKSEENVYMAALAGGARIIQPTLIDFLR